MSLTTQQDNFSVAFTDIDNTQKMCEKLLKTPHYAKLGLDGIYAIVAKANSLNVHPLEALNGGLYYVQGKVGMSSEMMASLIRQSGHSIVKDPKSDNSCVILHGKRSDNGDTWCISFSMEDARRAGLAKNMYEKYPSVMLYNRAMSMLARQLFPDVIKGAGYTMEELKEIAINKDINTDKFQKIEDVTSNSSVNNWEVPKVKEVITSEQAEALGQIIVTCNDEYIAKLWKTLNALNPPVKDLTQIPVDIYNRILTAAKKNVHPNETVPVEEKIA